MKRVVLGFLFLVMAPLAVAQNLIINPGSSVTISPDVTTTVTCSGSATVNSYYCKCEVGSGGSTYGIYQYAAGTNTLIQQITKPFAFSDLEDCVDAIMKKYASLCR